jgi:hypothetical protein
MCPTPPFAQFGRTHRSNQSSGPEYVLLQSGVAGEARFASAVARRMAGLGAISKGDHRAGGSVDMSQFDILEGRYSTAGLASAYLAVERGAAQGLAVEVKAYFDQPPWRGDAAAVAAFLAVCREGFVAVGLAEMKAVPPKPLPANFSAAASAAGAGAESEPAAAAARVFQFSDRAGSGRGPKADVTRFLNRLLAFPLAVQQQLFDLFSWYEPDAAVAWWRRGCVPPLQP